MAHGRKYKSARHTVPNTETRKRHFVSILKRPCVTYELPIPRKASERFAALADLWEDWHQEKYADHRDAIAYSGGFVYQVGRMDEETGKVKWQRGKFFSSSPWFGATDKKGKLADVPAPPYAATCREDRAWRLRGIAQAGGWLEGLSEADSRARIRVLSLFASFLYPKPATKPKPVPAEQNAAWQRHSLASLKGWATRRANAAKRSSAAKRGWATRRDKK